MIPLHSQHNSASWIGFLLAFCLIGSTFAYFGGMKLPRSVTPASTPSFPTLKSVILDPGHGGEDGGACTYGGAPEKDLNLQIAKDLNDMLLLFGYQVRMTRKDDQLLYDKQSDFHGQKKSQDLANRLKIAKQDPDAIFVSIHMNAFPETQYRGLQVYYARNAKNGEKLAQIIQNNAKTWLMPQNNRKPKAAGHNIYLLERMENTGILIECGFLSNPEERDKLNTAAYRKQLSGTILASLLEFVQDQAERVPDALNFSLPFGKTIVLSPFLWYNVDKKRL